MSLILQKCLAMPSTNNVMHAPIMRNDQIHSYARECKGSIDGEKERKRREETPQRPIPNHLEKATSFKNSNMPDRQRSSQRIGSNARSTVG